MRHLATILVFILAGAASSTKVVSGNEPRLYGGRTLAEWDDRIKAFAYSSREAAEAVPALIEIVKDAAAPWESRRQAALTLGRMGRPAVEAVPVLVRLAGPASREETRLWALSALGRFGRLAPEAAPTMVSFLSSTRESHLVRMGAAEVLGQIGPAHPVAIPALIDCISRIGSDSSEVSSGTDLRVACTDVLSLSGAAAAPAIPLLLRVMRDPSERLRQSALTTLAAMGPAAEIAALPVAEVLVSDRDELTCDRAAEVLVAMRVEPVVLRLLSFPRPEIRVRIATALSRWARPPEAVRRAVASVALQDGDPAVQGAALWADWIWSRDRDRLAPVALGLLEDEARVARKAGYRVLREAIPFPVEVESRLESLRGSEDADLRRLADALLRHAKSREIDAIP
jgi:HEAT repeat protein